MKLWTTLFLLLFMNISYASTQCVDHNGSDISGEPVLFTEIIESASTCYEASSLAQACAWGSSLDVNTAGFAYETCKKELNKNKPSLALKRLLKKMEKACDNKYAEMSGTLYMSMNAYCHLSAIEWVNNLSFEE